MTAPVSTVSDEQPPVASEPATPSLPDRADAPVSEVTERFLRAVIAEVPLELIEELHLFSPLRQGTVETGIAVLAARVPVVEAEVGEPELPFADNADTASTAEALTAEALTAEALTAEADDAAVEAVEAEAGDAEAGDAEAGDAEAGDAEAGDAEGGETETAEAEAVDAVDAVDAVEAAADDAPLGDEAIVIVEATDVVAAEGDDDESVATDDADDAFIVEAPAMPAAKPVRHTVYTARYRYVIKGPERGKWEASIKAEADAPLITVETVVRGVQRRAGEESEIVRYTGAQIARALRIPLTA